MLYRSILEFICSEVYWSAVKCSWQCSLLFECCKSPAPSPVACVGLLKTKMPTNSNQHFVSIIIFLRDTKQKVSRYPSTRYNPIVLKKKLSRSLSSSTSWQSLNLLSPVAGDHPAPYTMLRFII